MCTDLAKHICVDAKRADRARALACHRLPRLLSHFEFEVGPLPSAEQDDASLARSLTNCQRALSRIATEDSVRGRSQQASLLAAACNALTLHQHLTVIESPLAEQVLDGVERSLDKAAQVHAGVSF
jgi:hypothetical protein